MMANPIVRKEVLMSLRTRKAIFMQAAFFVVLIGLVWLLWPADGLQDVGGGQARRILSVLAVGELIMVVMFAPAFTAASITLEKERNTFEGLFATLMRPWEIALGKIVGALTFLVLLTLSGIPALSMPFLLGGIAGGDVLAVVAILLVTAIYLGMIGLTISTIMHRSYRSIIVTYVILLLVVLAFALPAWPVPRSILARGGPIWQGFWHIIASLSPLQAMLSKLWPDSQYAIGATSLPPFWVTFLIEASVVIIAATALCLYKLHRPVQPPRPREKLQVIERGQITARSFLFLIDPRKRRRSIGWWQNPVLSKEFRTRPMLQTQWLLRAFSVCLIASGVLMFLVGLGVQTFVTEGGSLISLMATAISAMIIVLIVLIGPAISGGSICSDRETGVWDLMRSTPLPSWRIVSGKFQSSIIPLVLVGIATLPATAILLYFDPNMLPNVLWFAAVLGMTILFVATAGTFFSSIFPRTSTATAWTYGLVVTMSLMTLMVLLGQDLFSDRFIETVFLVNPVIAAMQAAGDPPGDLAQMDILVPHLKIMGIATAALFVVTVFRVFQLRRAE